IVIGRVFAASKYKEEDANSEGDQREQKFPEVEFTDETHDYRTDQNWQLRPDGPACQQSESDHHSTHNVRSGNIVENEHSSCEIAQCRKCVADFMAACNKRRPFNKQKHPESDPQQVKRVAGTRISPFV